MSEQRPRTITTMTAFLLAAALTTACGSASGEADRGAAFGDGEEGRPTTSAPTTSAPNGNGDPTTSTTAIAGPGGSAPTTTRGGTPRDAGISATTLPSTSTTRVATTTTKATTTTTKLTTTTTKPPPNRRGITSYNRITPGAPYYGSFRSAWQPFVAQSNTITYLAATVGGGSGSSFLIRLTTAGTDGCGTGVIAGGYAGIVQYGESGIDIGDVGVTPGATYYICYNTPNYPTINSWVTYWWAGGNSITTSDQMQAKVQGYNR